MSLGDRLFLWYCRYRDNGYVVHKVNYKLSGTAGWSAGRIILNTHTPQKLT